MSNVVDKILKTLIPISEKQFKKIIPYFSDIDELARYINKLSNPAYRKYEKISYCIIQETNKSWFNVCSTREDLISAIKRYSDCKTYQQILEVYIKCMILLEPFDLNG